MSDPKIVAISGISCAGKTTTVKQLAKEFNCPFLLFDDHTDKGTYPENMRDWLINGADVSLIKTPKFVNALQELMSKSSNDFIFIEEPFGKERNELSALIDYVILLEQPLELCLARVIKRHTSIESLNSLNSISCYLDKYQDHFRDIYIVAANQVRNNCDLIFQEITSVEYTAKFIGNWLKNERLMTCEN
jgi:uridine kinase